MQMDLSKVQSRFHATDLLSQYDLGWICCCTDPLRGWTARPTLSIVWVCDAARLECEMRMNLRGREKYSTTLYVASLRGLVRGEMEGGVVTGYLELG